MSVLITGATGLLGSALAKKILHEGFVVKVLVRQGSNTSIFDEIIDKIEIIEGDILDVSSLNKAIEGVSMVVHAAAIVSFDPKEKTQMFKTNIEGTTNVVNECLNANVKKLVYISSIAALGRPYLLKKNTEVAFVINELQKWEESDLNSNYAKSKYLAECEVWRGEAEGLNVNVLCPSIILGEGDWTKSSTQLFKYVFDENPFYTKGFINYVDVLDVAQAILLSLKSDNSGTKFILSAGRLSYKEFFEEIARRFVKRAPRKEIGEFWIKILWRLEAFKAWLIGSKPLITRETAVSSQLNVFYEGDKIIQHLDFKYTLLSHTLDRIVNNIKV